MSNPNFRSVNTSADSAEDSIEDRLNRLRADADAIADEAEELPDDIRSSLDDMDDRITELYDIVSAQAAQSMETVEEIIETRPWASVAVAFVAGAVLTLLVT